MNIYIKLLTQTINVALNNIRGIINEQTNYTEIRSASSSGKSNITIKTTEQHSRDNLILTDAEMPRASRKLEIPRGTIQIG